MKTLMLFFIIAFLPQISAQECENLGASTDVASFENFLLDIGKVILEEGSSIIKKIDDEKSIVRTNVSGEICAIPTNDENGLIEFAGDPICISTDGDSDHFYSVNFQGDKLNSGKLETQMMFFAEPFNRFMKVVDAKIFAQQMIDEYGDHSFQNTYDQKLKVMAKQDKEITGAYVFEEKLQYFPQPFSQFMFTSDALTLAIVAKATNGDDSYEKAFKMIIGGRKIHHQF